MPTCCYEIYIDSDNTGFERIYQSDQLDDNNLILSPHLRKGTNKASIFDFTVLPGHSAYDNFKKMSTYVRLDRDGQTIFYGRVSDVKTDIYKQKEINCEGSLTFLKDSILAPNTFMDITTEQSSGKKAKKKRYPNGEPKMSVEAFFRSLITTHNAQMSGTSDINTRKQFTVGTVSVNKRNVVETFEIKSYSDIGSVISSQLLEKYGGIIQTRYDKDNAINYIDWIEDYTTTNNQAIEFGVNLLEIDSEKASDELWTMLLPIGADGITISSVNNNSLYIPANPANDSMVQKYGKIIHYKKFEDVKKASTLLSKATEYFNLHRKDYPDTLTLKAADFHYLTPNTKQALDIGTRISVVSAPHGINVVRDCIEMDLDIQVFENSTYTIGSIIPPDDEGKSGKSSLSSRHSSSSRMAGTAFNELSDRIDDLQSDVNINADNIAITAQNMAISVQNLALDLIGDENHTGRITATANELRVEYNEALYGEGGTAENPTGGIVTEYQSAISATAQDLTSDYTEKLYGAGGTEANPTGGIVSEYRSNFTQTAREINSRVTYTDFNGNEIASRINQTATTILIQAQHINLDGYVTASQLSTTNANITNLTSGSTKASHLKGTSMSADNLYVYRSAGASSEYKKFIPSFLTLSSSLTKSFILATSDIDITHSHSVSVGTDGTVTLGGAVATNATNRSFKIADTKTYQDGVSAATAAGVASVTVSSIGRRSGESDTYNSSSSSHTTTVHLVATASNGATKNQDITVYGTSAYNDGYSAGQNSVTVSSIVQYQSASFYSSTNRYGVHLKATASNNKSLSTTLYVDGTSAYNNGYSDGHDDGYDEGYGEGYDDGYSIGYSETDHELTDDVSVNRCDVRSVTNVGDMGLHVVVDIELTDGHHYYESFNVDATKAYNKGYANGKKDGHTEAMVDCTVTYVNVIRPQNYASVNVHYGSSTYTKACYNYSVTG